MKRLLCLFFVLAYSIGVIYAQDHATKEFRNLPPCLKIERKEHESLTKQEREIVSEVLLPIIQALIVSGELFGEEQIKTFVTRWHQANPEAFDSFPMEFQKRFENLIPQVQEFIKKNEQLYTLFQLSETISKQLMINVYDILQIVSLASLQKEPAEVLIITNRVKTAFDELGIKPMLSQKQTEICGQYLQLDECPDNQIDQAILAQKITLLKQLAEVSNITLPEELTRVNSLKKDE